MSFWNDLVDNSTLVIDAYQDATDPTSWLTGSAPRTAADVAKQVTARGGTVDPTSIAANGGAGGLVVLGTAVTDTGSQIAEDPLLPFKRGAESVGSLLPWWAPWALAGAGLVVIAVVAAPYVGVGKELLK